jgi:hypothetical protein
MREAFNNAFQTTADGLSSVPALWTARLRCAISGEIHDFEFSGAAHGKK